MSRYHYCATYVAVPPGTDPNIIIQEEHLDCYWDYMSITKTPHHIDIKATQLGSVPGLADRIAEKHPDFIILEVRSGETGYYGERLLRGKLAISQKKFEGLADLFAVGNLSESIYQKMSERFEKEKAE